MKKTNYLWFILMLVMISLISTDFFECTATENQNIPLLSNVIIGSIDFVPQQDLVYNWNAKIKSIDTKLITNLSLWGEQRIKGGSWQPVNNLTVEVPSLRPNETKTVTGKLIRSYNCTEFRLTVKQAGKIIVVKTVELPLLTVEISNITFSLIDQQQGSYRWYANATNKSNIGISFQVQALQKLTTATDAQWSAAGGYNLGYISPNETKPLSGPFIPLQTNGIDFRVELRRNGETAVGKTVIFKLPEKLVVNIPFPAIIK